ncbi:MAG: sugar phosphate isomerase/epimerase family protein [Planctomycetia bacterium]|nr:sugar phosphate isomerase/epimerase family protein [Planctomycetia bacterium]
MVSAAKWPVGVFVSLDAGLGVKWEVVKELGIRSIQMHTPHASSRTPEKAAAFRKQLADAGVALSVVFCGYDGESYADIPTVAKTIGLVPPETRAIRVQETKEIADFAALVGSPAIGLHIGFVPHDRSDPMYTDVLAVAREICDYCAVKGLRVHLETGQEPADVLLGFLEDVNRDNLFINFDPANMILYGCGEPLPALRKLAKYIRSIHCKDAEWSDRPGETWGREVPFGTGQVDAKAFLRTLYEIGYEGPLTIEREIPQEPERQKAEIGQALDLINGIEAEIFG